MSVTRRQFLHTSALAAGAGLLSGPLSAAASKKSASLAQRTAAAKARYARVAAFINRDYPALRDKTVAAAEEGMRGQLLLPGSAQLSSVGIPPAWLTPQHQDEEFLWGLNRMMHWKTLLQAHALTGERKYAEKVVTELDDWIARTQPPPLRQPDGTPDTTIATNAGPPPWRALEVGIRMFDSWPVLIEQLGGTEFLPEERLARLHGSVTQHAEEIALLSPLLWPEADHNHYFMEMLGLLGIGVYYPELSRSAAWTSQAVRELQRCVDKQFTADGGHIEACPSYHNICVVLLARFLDFARAAGSPLPESVTALAARAAEQTLHSVRPDGKIVMWGDSTKNNQVEAALWTYRATGDANVLQHLVALMGLPTVREHAVPHLWDIEDPAALFVEAVKQPTAKRSLVRFDRGNDQVMARTSWEWEALSVFFSCHSPLVPGSGHQHIDLGGFDFTAFGRTLVIDPGVLTYRESADRKLFKSAPYHSVLTVDGREPFDYINRWRYTPQKEGRVSAVKAEADLVRIDSFHRNYEPALCRRSLVLLDRRLLVVLDVVEGLKAESSVQIYFHLDSTQVHAVAGERKIVTADKDVRLGLHFSAGLDATLLPGRVSEVFDTERASTRVCLVSRNGATRRVFASVLAPYRAAEAEPKVDALVVGEKDVSFRCDGREHRVPVTS